MATNSAKSKPQKWYNQHYWSLLLALAFFAAAYAIATRALDTGSWQQYGLTFLFLVLGIHRLGHAAHTTAKSLWLMLIQKKGASR